MHDQRSGGSLADGSRPEARAGGDRGERNRTAGGGARSMLWLRSIDEVTARPLPGTEDAFGPFWSPDNRWVGFFAEGKVKKIPSAGGPVQTVANGSEFRGGSWNRDDTILLGSV